LKEWRPYDRLLLARNPAYYEAGLVSLDEGQFFGGTAEHNHGPYQAGEVHHAGRADSQQFGSLLEGKRYLMSRRRSSVGP
jgi:hypothetical protein